MYNLGNPLPTHQKRKNPRNASLKRVISEMNYREMVMRNSPNFETDDFNTKLSLGALGLGGEAGEVVDLIKKVLHHDQELDVEKLKKEMGDVRWYLEYLAASIGTTMDEIEQINIDKLLKRYPNGFNFEDAKKKRDENE